MMVPIVFGDMEFDDNGCKISVITDVFLMPEETAVAFADAMLSQNLHDAYVVVGMYQKPIIFPTTTPLKSDHNGYRETRPF